MKPALHDSLTRKILAEATHVHSVLGFGFADIIYQNALILRLKQVGLKVDSQHPLPVFYEGELVGDFLADIIVEDSVLLEIKAISELSHTDEAKTVNLLCAAKIEIGLLLNFGAEEFEFKRKNRPPAPNALSQIPEIASP